MQFSFRSRAVALFSLSLSLSLAGMNQSGQEMTRKFIALQQLGKVRGWSQTKGGGRFLQAATVATKGQSIINPQEPVVGSLVGLIFMQRSRNATQHKIHDTIWKHLGYTLTRDEERDLDQQSVNEIFYRIHAVPYIRDLTVKNINPKNVFMLELRNLDTTVELVETFNRENRREAPISTELYGRIKDLPNEILANFVVPSPTGDQLLYVTVPSTWSSNAKEVVKKTMAGAIMCGAVSFAGVVAYNTIDNVGEAAKSAGIAAVKSTLMELAKPAVKQYIHETTHNGQMIETVVRNSFEESAGKDAGIMDNHDHTATIHTFGRVTKEYTTQVGKDLCDPKKAAEFFSHEIKVPAIAHGKKAVIDTLTDPSILLSPRTYTQGLNATQTAQAVSFGSCVGGFIGLCKGLQGWGNPIVPSVSIRHINDGGDKPKTSLLRPDQKPRVEL